jgi:hypothetical protein
MVPAAFQHLGGRANPPDPLNNTYARAFVSRVTVARFDRKARQLIASTSGGQPRAGFNQEWIPRYSVVFLNGDLEVGSPNTLYAIGDSLVVCDGNVTVTADVHDSVIVTTGSVSVGGDVEDSVIISGGAVQVNLAFPGTPAVIKNSSIQMHRRDPLNFIHFFDLAEVGIKVKASRQEVRVEEVAAGKCFAQAGVRKGDRILAVEGVKVVSAEGLRRLLRRLIQESNVIRLEICREEKQLQVDVHVSGDAP